MKPESELILKRHQKLKKLIAQGEEPFKKNFRRDTFISEVFEAHRKISAGVETSAKIRVAGRIMAKREHGKASFAVLRDGTGSLQLYLTLNNLGKKKYGSFLNLDIGDIIGTAGTVFKTHRGELSLKVKNFSLLSKSLRPLPEKWHGLKDIEIRHRKRYLDLLMNPQVKEVFLKRDKVIKVIRELLDARGFFEVETPSLQSLPGGATAHPFTTHYQALGRPFYLRIAPELYLKRLVVGGLEKVYELGKNFRNEGISTKHNPEFTMLEVYQAYTDYLGMLKLAQDLIKKVVRAVQGSFKVSYQGKTLDFGGPFKVLTMLEVIKKVAGLKLSFTKSLSELKEIAKKKGVTLTPPLSKGKIVAEIFEKLVEPNLFQPTFVKDYPKEISPLARPHPQDPNLVERFELIVAGKEIANAFSELTDPLEQRKRFEEQLKLFPEELGKVLDEDFLEALEYGLPPTGGLGIGIDRLVMLLTDSYSIREVVLFPQLRPEPSGSGLPS